MSSLHLEQHMVVDENIILDVYARLTKSSD
jgi:hypothetical protein